MSGNLTNINMEISQVFLSLDFRNFYYSDKLFWPTVLAMDNQDENFGENTGTSVDVISNLLTSFEMNDKILLHKGAVWVSSKCV